MGWSGWPLERVLLVFVGLAFLLIGVQVTMFHYRQNFHHKSMWIPVLATPVFFVADTALGLYEADWLRTLCLVLMYVGAAAGLLGFYYHVRGVGIRVGGYALRNWLIGPPAVLPLLITAMSVLGLIALYWKEA